MRLFIIISILFSSLITFAGDKTTETFTLDHQMTGMCKKRITENMRFEKGVSKIDISIPDNTITITFDAEKTSTEQLIRAFKKIGFNAILINPKGTRKEEETQPQAEKVSYIEEAEKCDCSSICAPECGCCSDYNNI